MKISINQLMTKLISHSVASEEFVRFFGGGKVLKRVHQGKDLSEVPTRVIRG